MASRTAATRSASSGQPDLQLEAGVAVAQPGPRALRHLLGRPGGERHVHRQRVLVRLGERALLLARVQVEPGDLLGGARLRRPPPAAAGERGGGALERHAVVRLEGGRLAVADRAVARLEPQQEQLARRHHARRGHERLLQRDRQPQDRPLDRAPSREQHTQGEQQREDREQPPGRGQGAVQRGPVGAGPRPSGPAAAPAAAPRAPAAATPTAPGSARSARRRPRRPSPRTALAPGRAPASPRASVCPARRSVSTSRTLFTTRIAAASSPTGTPSATASQRSSSVWTKYEPGHRHEPEEREHEQLAEALVAVRARPARVEHAGQDRGGAHHQQLPARPRRRGRARPPPPRRRPRRSPRARAAAASGRRRSRARARAGPRCRRRGGRPSSRSTGSSRSG